MSGRVDAHLTSRGHGGLWPSWQCRGCSRNESVPLIPRFWLPFAPPFDVRVCLQRGGVFMGSLRTCTTSHWRPGDGGGGGEQNPTKPPRPDAQTAGAAGEPDNVFSETEGKSATFFLYAIKGSFNGTATPSKLPLTLWGQVATSGTGRSPDLTYHSLLVRSCRPEQGGGLGK